MTRTGPSDKAQRPCVSFRRGSAVLGGLLLLAVWAGCSDARTVVVVSVAGLDPQVQSVRTTATLGGQTDVEVFTSGLSQFGLRLPASTSGQLSLTLEGLGANQCVLAGGNGSVDIVSGQSRADVTVSLLPLASPNCGSPADMGGTIFPVTVTKSAGGTSNGVVTSNPPGINCGAACSAAFPQGGKVTLSVVPDYRSLFIGWSGDCMAVEGVCTLSPGTTATATARFAVTPCSLDRVCQKLPTPLPTTRFRAVWGTSPNNVWVVGHGGTIMHWDGALFSPVQSGTNSDLFSIWGTGPSDFWVGSTNGLVLRWNGTTFTPMTITGAQDITAIWGSGLKDVWFVDGTSTLQHFTGINFVPMATGSGTALTAIWGSSANDFWVTSISGNVVHWIGNGFAISSSGTTSLLTAIWGSAASDVWAVSAINSMTGYATIVHYKFRLEAIGSHIDPQRGRSLTNRGVRCGKDGQSPSLSVACLRGSDGLCAKHSLAGKEFSALSWRRSSEPSS